MSNAVAVAKNLEDLCRKAGAPLSARQFLLIAGAIPVWLEQAREQGRADAERQLQAGR